MQPSSVSLYDSLEPSPKANSAFPPIKQLLPLRDLAAPALRPLSRAQGLPVLPVRGPLLPYAALPEYQADLSITSIERLAADTAPGWFGVLLPTEGEMA